SDLWATIPTGRLRVECKGMTASTARIRLQEAIGQTVTVRDRNEDDILAIAVPYSHRLEDLAREFLQAPIFKGLNIAIALVHNHGLVAWWRWNGQQVEAVPLNELRPDKAARIRSNA